MGICAGSMHTRGGSSCSRSNLPITTCWLLGAMVMLSLAFTSQALTGLEVLSRGESAGTPACPYTELPVGWVEGCVPLYPP